MDWLDPKYSKTTGATATKRKAKLQSKGKATKPRSLSRQVTAAMAQPVAVWAEAFDQSLAKIRWSPKCSAETSFLFSTVMHEQAEVLVRAGLPASKLSAIIAETTPATDAERAEQVAQIVGLMSKSLESMAFEWIDSSDKFADSALGVAAITWHLPQHARRPAGEWIPQWLQAVVDRFQGPVAFDSEAAAICSLVTGCELPLLTATLVSAKGERNFEEVSLAMDTLAEILERSEDDSSAWLAYGATYLRAALASVFRCRMLANNLGLRAWYPPQRKALGNLLVHAARWARHDGTQLLGAGTVPSKAKAQWEALLGLAQRKKSTSQVMTLHGLIKGKSSEAKSLANLLKLPGFTYYSDSASGAVFQSDWFQKGSRVAVDFSDNEICLEALGPKGHPLLAGEWTLNVALDGQTQMQLDEWGEVCWFSDEDVDYLEVEAKFGKHARVQRQVVLFREDRLLLLADALLAEQPGNWETYSALPLGSDTTFLPEKRNSEGYLEGRDGTRCPVIPLYLPEWKSQAANGSLVQTEEHLICHSHSLGKQRMYSPVIVSLCNRHGRKPFTWRQLTVGEDLRIVGSDEAAAFRIQLGREQLLMYRTLATAARRTALGQHTLADFLAGRFDCETGDLDTLVEVEVTE